MALVKTKFNKTMNNALMDEKKETILKGEYPEKLCE